MKKRAAAFMMSFMLFASACPVFASDFVWEGVVDKNQVQVGELFSLDLDVISNPGLQNSTIDIEYDPNVVIPVATESAAEDILCYEDSFGSKTALFGASYINNIIANANVESGNLRIANFTTASDENGMLVEIKDTGTLARVTFKAIGSGDANLHLGKAADVKANPIKALDNLADRIDLPNVTVVSGNSSSDDNNVTTATTEKSTEVTTRSPIILTVTTTTAKETATETTTAKAETTTAKTEATSEVTTAAPVDTASFIDLGATPWASEYINKLASKGIINGYNDNTFRPSNNVKRADFIIMLLKAMDVDTTKVPSANFSDVRSDKYYYNAVGIAKEMGIASGNNDGTFNPESNITRQDMMILAKKALEMRNGKELDVNASALDKFTDKASISPYATDSLAAMVDAGVVSGSNNQIKPKDNTTRAQSAVIICKILDLMK